MYVVKDKYPKYLPFYDDMINIFNIKKSENFYHHSHDLFLSLSFGMLINKYLSQANNVVLAVKHVPREVFRVSVGL